MSRREWLALSAAAVAAGRDAYARQPDRRWGVQLYTVRAQVSKDPSTTLERIAAIGYKELEIMQPTLDVVAPIARKLGMTMVSAHLDMKTVANEGLSPFIAKAKQHGLKHLVVPYIAPADRPVDRDGFQRVGERLARMAEEAQQAGLELGYHNHAFEFGSAPGGARWLDVLLAAAPSVKLQLDVFWASVTGADPVAMIKQYSGRVVSLHLKDKKPGTPNTLSEQAVPREAYVEVGAGDVNIPAVLSAARSAGVQHYFVEQDATAGDPVDSLRKSIDYLARQRG